MTIGDVIGGTGAEKREEKELEERKDVDKESRVGKIGLGEWLGVIAL